MGDSSIQPELYESGPSKFEWALAFFLFIILFTSFFYLDSAFFATYELKFAEAILHGNINLAYENPIDITIAAGNHVNRVSDYDMLPNLLLGLWGIPLYLWCSRSGQLIVDFPQSFGQMIYAKSFLLIAFIISTVLVYKLCRAVAINENRSRWGAYLYFTSALSTTTVGITGQCDVLPICFILLGTIAYIKNENKKFLFWFIIGAQFKQYAFFVFMPLLLLREKNLLKIAGKVILLWAVYFICNLPIFMNPKALAEVSNTKNYILMMVFDYRLNLFWGNVPLFVLLLGGLCTYCWLHEYKDSSDTEEINHTAIFTALLSMTFVFMGFHSYPYWFIHLAPWLAVAAVYNPKETLRILFLETIAIGIFVILHYFDPNNGSVTPNNARGMLIDKLFGDNKTVGNAITNTKNILSEAAAIKTGITEGPRGTTAMLREKFKYFLATGRAVYVIFMFAIAWLSRPQNYTRGGGGVSSYQALCLVKVDI